MSETTPSTSTPTDDDVVDAEIITPSEEIDAIQLEKEHYAEFLSDMPALLPPERFRLGHRNAFKNLSLEAQKSGAFDRTSMDYDFDNPEDITAYQKLAAFIESIDTWAESIARDPRAYARWSEGKTENHFLTLFNHYKRALGESRGSAS